MHGQLLIAAYALFLASTPASANMIWGANGHPLTAYPGLSIEEQFKYLKDLGLKSYRINVVSADQIPQLAKIIAKAKKYDIAILPVITPGDVDLDKDNPQILYGKARQLAETLGSHFKNDIRVWELGNEMENYAIIQPCEMRDDGTQYPCEWGHAGGMSPLDYYGPRWKKVSAVLKGLSDGMEAVDPQIRKAIGTAGWGHRGAFDRMQQDGVDWDITVWHSYSENKADTYAALSAYGKPIWVTEFNAPGGSQKGEKEQAEYLKKTMKLLSSYEKKYDVEAAFIYELMDETYWAPDFEAQMGLVRLVETPEGDWRAGEPKPAYFAVRDAIRGELPTPTPPDNCSNETAGDNSADVASSVRYAYCLLLGRSPGPMTVATWAAVLRQSDKNIRGLFLDLTRSEEFEEKYGLRGTTDKDYVKFLYLLLLGRPADNAGLESYVKSLASGSMTRTGVARGIILSAEFAEKHSSLLKAIQMGASRGRPG